MVGQGPYKSPYGHVLPSISTMLQIHRAHSSPIAGYKGCAETGGKVGPSRQASPDRIQEVSERFIRRCRAAPSTPGCRSLRTPPELIGRSYTHHIIPTSTKGPSRMNDLLPYRTKGIFVPIEIRSNAHRSRQYAFLNSKIELPKGRLILYMSVETSSTDGREVNQFLFLLFIRNRKDGVRAVWKGIRI